MGFPDDTNISDFEGEEDYQKDMDESNTDSGESDNSTSEIEHEDILPLESGESDNF